MKHEKLPNNKLFINKFRGRKIPLRSYMQAIWELQSEINRQKESKYIIILDKITTKSINKHFKNKK